jgi:DNA-binding response OmpR family regulator
MSNLQTDELKTDQLPNLQTGELKPNLLIVEDNPDLRHFIAETMQSDYQIMTAENGKIGLAAAIEHTPDLIISDVMMPEMDGFEMCETLKKDERTSHIPIILLTAKAGQRHKVEGLETGADAYLTKPFDEQELLVRAKNLVEQRRKLQERFAGVGRLEGVQHLKPEEVIVTSTDQRFLEKVTAAIEQNMDNEFFSVEDLASQVAFSRSQLHRKLKALTGKSPNELIREFRMMRAKELLEKGAGNVSEVAMEVGYSSLSYFTRSFKQAFGVLPSEV